MSSKNKSKVADATVTEIVKQPIVETPTAAIESPVAEMIAPVVLEAVISPTEAPIVEAPVVVDAPVVQQVATVVNGIEMSVALADVYAQVKATGNQAVILAFNAIFDYMVAMKPGITMPDDTGARNQANLYRAIRAIIENSENDFQISFATLLKLFDEYKEGVFNEKYIFRFIENLTLNMDDQQAYRRIVNLIKIAAPVQGRAEALKQLSFTKSLQYGFTDAGKQKVLTFFNV